MLVDGILVDGSTAAHLEGGVVVAPLAPYFGLIADGVACVSERRIAFSREGRRVWIRLGSARVWSDDTVQTLPIAPYVRAGEVLIPLAAVARDLGASVDYDAATHTLTVQTAAAPLSALTPDPGYTPPARPEATFTPNPTPAPPVQVTGVPRPRRTPISITAGSR